MDDDAERIEPSRPDQVAPIWAAASAGLVSAGVALAAGELVVAIPGRNDPSLVSAVGAEFIDRFAAELKDVAVRLFGTNDKVALVCGIVLVSMVLGALLGTAARRRFWPAVCGFSAFGLLGAAAYRTDELGSDTLGTVAAAVAAAAGIATMWSLLRMAARLGAAPRSVEVDPAGDGVRVGDQVMVAPRSPLDPRHIARRAFLGTAAALGAGAAGMALVGRRIAGKGSSEAARQQVVLPAATVYDRDAVAGEVAPEEFDVGGLSPYITPNDDFYRIDTALSVPQVDLDSWRLRIKGMVDHPLEVSYADLLDMESVSATVTIACVSNEVGGGLVGNAVWQGVPLADVIERAGVGDGAEQVIGRSIDGWTAGFPVDVVTDGRTAMVAYAMNGEPLPVRHGFPARLIVAGLYGYVSATKWLAEIELSTWNAFDGYWVPRGWSKEGPIKTQSRIDVPRSGAELRAGTVPVAGVAWAPTRGISKVEVQVDDGPWRPCELGPVSGDETWVQWIYRWRAEPGDHVVSVRATDGDGETQTSDVARPDPDGATGWHSRRWTVTG